MYKLKNKTQYNKNPGLALKHNRFAFGLVYNISCKSF